MSFATTSFYTGETWRTIYVRLIGGHYNTYALVETSNTHEAFLAPIVSVNENTVVLDMAELRWDGEYYEFPVLL